MGEECSELQCFRTSGLTDSTNMTVNLHTSLSVNLRLGMSLSGFPGGISGKESTWQSTRHKRGEFDPLAGRSPGEGHGLPLRYSATILLPGESHGQRGLAGYSP